MHLFCFFSFSAKKVANKMQIARQPESLFKRRDRQMHPYYIHMKWLLLYVLDIPLLMP